MPYRSKRKYVRSTKKRVYRKRKPLRRRAASLSRKKAMKVRYRSKRKSKLSRVSKKVNVLSKKVNTSLGILDFRSCKAKAYAGQFGYWSYHEATANTDVDIMTTCGTLRYWDDSVNKYVNRNPLGEGYSRNNSPIVFGKTWSKVSMRSYGSDVVIVQAWLMKCKTDTTLGPYDIMKRDKTDIGEGFEAQELEICPRDFNGVTDCFYILKKYSFVIKPGRTKSISWVSPGFTLDATQYTDYPHYHKGYNATVLVIRHKGGMGIDSAEVTNHTLTRNELEVNHRRRVKVYYQAGNSLRYIAVSTDIVHSPAVVPPVPIVTQPEPVIVNSS